MICDNCKEECDEHSMFPVNTGRRVQHMCPKCYLKGQSDSGILFGERRAVSKKIKVSKRK